MLDRLARELISSARLLERDRVDLISSELKDELEKDHLPDDLKRKYCLLMRYVWIYCVELTGRSANNALERAERVYSEILSGED